MDTNDKPKKQESGNRGFDFKLIHKDSSSEARFGKIVTPHGEVEKA